MLNYATAKAMLQKVELKKVGKRLGNRVFLVKFKNDYIITRNGEILLSVNKDNEFTILFAQPSKLYVKWLNKFLPAKVKLRDKRLFVGNVPFFAGMKLNVEGDVIINEPWEPALEYQFHCKLCAGSYSKDRCARCTTNMITNLRNVDNPDHDEYEALDEDDDY